MSQSMSQDHALSRAGHGKSDASKTRMHRRPYMHGVPMATTKHTVVSLLTLAQGCAQNPCMWDQRIWCSAQT